MDASEFDASLKLLNGRRCRALQRRGYLAVTWFYSGVNVNGVGCTTAAQVRSALHHVYKACKSISL